MNSSRSPLSNAPLQISCITHNSVLKSIQRLKLGILLPQDMSLDEPREPCTHLIAHEATSWDREDIVEFFEGTLLQSTQPVSKAFFPQDRGKGVI